MDIPDEQFDRLLAVFQEFDLRDIDLEERWCGLKDIEPTQFTALRTRCEEIEDFAIGLGKKVRAGELADETARYQLAEKYPFLTPERLRRAWSQAIFFSMK